MNSLQHRGQEATGMAIDNGEEILRKRAMGLVIDAYTEESLRELAGNIGIGHVRYSTAEGSHDYNIQPIMGFVGGETIAIANDGNLVNYQVLRERLEEEGMMFQTTNDTEVILYLITRYYDGDIVAAIKKTMKVIKGAYSVTALVKGKVVAFRDPNGFRPLVLGRDEDDVIVASENAAIEIIGGQMTRDIGAGKFSLSTKRASTPITSNRKPHRKTAFSNTCILPETTPPWTTLTPTPSEDAAAKFCGKKRPVMWISLYPCRTAAFPRPSATPKRQRFPTAKAW